jgi:predicted nucleic acid-binding protein
VIRYLLDTNIISDARKPIPSPVLASWMTAQVDESLYISTLTVAEIHRGILILPAGRRRRELEGWFSGMAGPQMLFAGRILPFDEDAAVIWARLMAEGEARGRPRNSLDMILAATAVANDCVMVTANERDFTGVKVLNPMRASH